MEHILIATAAQVDQNDLILAHGLGDLHHLVQRVAGLEGGQDAFGAGAESLRLERLRVGRILVLHPPDGLELRVLRADSGVIEPRRDRVRLLNLAVGSLQKVGAGAMEHAHDAIRKGGGVLVGLGAVGQPRTVLAARLDAHDLHVSLGRIQARVGVVEEGGEHADGVRTASDARDDHVRQTARPDIEGWVAVLSLGLVEHLRTRLVADHRLQIAHDVREGMGANGRSDDVVRRADVGHPITEGLVHGVLERPRARLDRHYLGAHLGHAEAVELLPLAIDGAHVHDALEPEERARGGGRHAVLPGAGLGDNALLAQLDRQQSLSNGVVDLMSARVRELLALHPDLRATHQL